MIHEIILISAILVTHAFAKSYPHDELNSDAAIDSILEEHPVNYEFEVPAVPRFNFHLPDWDVDAEYSFLELGAKAFDSTKIVEDDPIQCSTVCKPLSVAKKEAAAAKAAAQKPNPTEESKSAKPSPSSFAEIGADISHRMSFLELSVSKQICEGKSGGWNDEKKECEHFMVATKEEMAWNGKEMFELCSKEIGTLYVPCNPYQALALSHSYDIPDHSYYWLFPGGRHVTNAAMKQGIGHNPVVGLDTCNEHSRVGFFHNWDEAHVDSWGCLDKDLVLPTLCCRRN